MLKLLCLPYANIQIPKQTVAPSLELEFWQAGKWDVQTGHVQSHLARMPATRIEMIYLAFVLHTLK